MLAWLEITVTTSYGGGELAQGLLESLGCVGTAWVTVDSRSSRVIGYLPATEDVTEKLAWLMERLEEAHQSGYLPIPASVETQLLDAEAWETPLRETLPPLQIGTRFLITLTDDPITSSRLVLRLRSLGGFGTGHHPTTQMCLELLEGCEMEGKHVLDVGTGSGILAIAAAKLGAGEIVATDIDDAALEAARENAQRNGVAERIRLVKSDLVRQVNGVFDLVLSNLLTPLIKDLAWQLLSRRVLVPGGVWIGSGISAESWDEVRALLVKLNYCLQDARSANGWVAFRCHLVSATD